MEELEKSLDADLDFQGSFAFSRSYEDAPNPILSLEGLGTIGLPLSEREARMIISKCDLAPFGKGERTIVDQDIRDTWEMDASKVAFNNPKWGIFMGNIVKEACAALGLDPRSTGLAELYKLLIYETGSHFLPHVDTEKANGMFATLVIVLPSQFTGGDAHLSHGGIKSIFNTSKPSLGKTSVLCWYTDVMHEIKPITSGYRLALTYNLLRITDSIPPSLPTQIAAVSNLRRILEKWKTQPDSTKKIIYKLEHKYSMANISARALKSKDSHLFAIVDSLAKDLGLCLGFAHIELRISGTGLDEHAYDSRKKRKGKWSGDPLTEEEAKQLVKFQEIEDRTTTIENLVDPSGNPISKIVQFNEEEEFIPKGFIRQLEESEEWDEQEYEGHMGNYAGGLDRYYRRTALIIWPPETQLGVGNWDRRALRAVETLHAPSEENPIDDETSLFDYICKSSLPLPKELTFPKLFKMSRSWKDFDRWSLATQAFQTNSDEETLPLDEIASATHVFGFSVVIGCVQSVIMEDKCNFSRLSFLSDFEMWAGSQPPLLAEKVRTFVAELKPVVMASLGPPQAPEMDLLTTEALRLGGVSWLMEKMMPQILPLSSLNFLEGYAGFLHRKFTVSDTPPEDAVIIKSVVTGILETALQRVDLFALVTPQVPKSSVSYWPVNSSIPQDAKRFLRLCLDCDNTNVALKALEKLVAIEGLSPDEARSRATTVLKPILKFLHEDLGARDPKPRLPLDKIARLVVDYSLQHIEVKDGGKFSCSAISELLDAAALTQDSSILTTMILPKIESFKWDPTSWKGLMVELQARQDVDFFRPIPIASIKREMSLTFARKVSLPGFNSRGYNASYTFRDQMDFAMKTGGSYALAVLLDRVVDSAHLNPGYINQTLIPLIPDLCAVAEKCSTSLSASPFSEVLRRIVNSWIEKVLGSKPDFAKSEALLAKLREWTCSCDACVRARRMLLETSETSVRIDRLAVTKRRHLEDMITQYATGAATWTVPNHRNVQSLEVKKEAIFGQVDRWKATQKLGIPLLQSIGDENTLKTIWGDGFNDLSEALYPGTREVAAVPGAQPATPTPLNAPPPPPRPLIGVVEASVPVTPAKRKAAPEAIIDLCTP